MSGVMTSARFRVGIGVLTAGAALLASASLASASGIPNVVLTPLGVPSLSAPSESLAVSPNGKTLYVTSGALIGTAGGPVYAVNLNDPTAAGVEITDGGSAITDATGLAVSPNGKYLYISTETTSGDPILVADVSGKASDPSDYTVIGGITDSGAPISDPFALTVSPNGKYLYTASEATTSGLPSFALDSIKLSTPSTGTVIVSKASGALGYPTGLAISSDGKRIYAADLAGPGSVTDVSGTTVNSTTTLPELEGAYSVALSPDGRTLYASELNLLEAESGDFRSEVNTLALSPNGQQVTLAHASELDTDVSPLGIALAPGGKAGYAGTMVVSEAGGSYTETFGASEFTVPAAASKVTISGQAKVGGKLTAKVKGVSGASDSFRWSASGKAIKGATKESLKLTASMKGKKISVKVTADDAVGYHPAQVAATEKSPVTG